MYFTGTKHTESESQLTVSDSLWPHGLYSPWNSLGQNKEWVAFPFSRGSSQPRHQTQVSHIAGGFFTSWAIREAQEHWSRWPIPSPGYLPDPGIELGSLELQEDSLPTELWGKTPNILNGPKYPLNNSKLLIPFLSLLYHSFCAQDSVIQVFLLLNIF